MTLDHAANLVKRIVSTGYSATDTTIVLNSGNALPAAPFQGVWWNVTDFSDPSDDPKSEIVRVTAVNGNTLTITRASEGPNGASTKNTAGKTYQFINGITAKMITDIGANLQQPWHYVDVQGDIDGVNTTFTISPAPYDPASVQLRLARQSQEQGIDYTILGATITYITAPDGSLSGLPHIAQYQ